MEGRDGCLRLPGAFGLAEEVEERPSDVLGYSNFIRAINVLEKLYGIEKYMRTKEELLRTVSSYQSEFGDIRSDARGGDVVDLVPLPGNLGSCRSWPPCRMDRRFRRWSART